MISFFDVVFSLLAIIVLLLFMLPIMILLKLTGEHDIFYGQERIGKGGKKFKLWKFATMLRNSPDLPGGTYTSADDPRMLPMGKFMRKTKINELPQLINILTGEMSVIGYRPLMFDLYSEPSRSIILSNPPGLSGIGSVAFRNEEEILQKVDGEERDRYYRERILPYKEQLEAWYARNRSIGHYFRLILMTIIAVLEPDYSGWMKLKDIPQPPEGLF